MINKTWQAGVYTLVADAGSAIWDIEGIRFTEDGKTKFLVTKLLCEEIPYIRDTVGYKHKLAIGMLISYTESNKFREIDLPESEDKYWRQFMKIKRL